MWYTTPEVYIKYIILYILFSARNVIAGITLYIIEVHAPDYRVYRACTYCTAGCNHCSIVAGVNKTYY